jgi:ABC-type dipeptide/oligopeptide/nickel transport system permease subunit
MRGFAGACVLGLTLAGAIAAPWILPHDPRLADPAKRLMPAAWAGGAAMHPLGTDQLGRDILVRLLHGARISLAVGVLSVLIAAPVGTLAGLLAGFRRSALDEVIMRVVDSQLSIPFLLLAIAVIAAIGPGTVNTILVLGFGGWPIYARMVRGETLGLREKEFVEAARAVGASDARILRRHLLPHVATTATVVASFAVAQMLILESTLSFLGLGVQPPTPSWGQMLADAKTYVTLAPHLSIFPGLAIAITVLAINAVGDWARDLLNPQTRSA